MKKLIGLLFVVLVISFWGCNDDFLERYPQDALNEKTFWKTENDLKIYNNSLYQEAGNNSKYDFIDGFWNSPWSSGYNGMFWKDCQSDNCAPKNSALDRYAKVAAGIQTVPSKNYAGGWYWTLLRKCNVFLENYEKANVPDVVKNRYAGETRLIRGWFYFDKVKKFGDVPWSGDVVELNSSILLGGRTPRNQVMDSVLKDLNFAVDNMSEEWYSSEPDRFNRWTALAIKSRICLYEGTYRKYRSIEGADRYLNEAVTAASEIINNGPFELSSDYSSVFTELDLTGNKEVILARKYVTGILGSRFKGYYNRKNGATKDFVEDFLCTDGKPVALSSVYQGDESIEKEYENRDPRLTCITVAPGTNGPFEGTKWGKFPVPRLEGQSGGFISTTGYSFGKFFDYEDWKKGYGKEENDAPLIRLAEIMLNYAEAKATLGTLTQADLDMSINVLRDRVGMVHMDVNPPMDPKYAGEGISSVLVEIRRERRVELGMEGFRYDDLMRWKKGHYMAKRVLGMRLEDDQLALFPNTSVKRVEIGGKKYIDVYQGSQLGTRNFDEKKHYLMPIPLSEISMNPALKQNPEW